MKTLLLATTLASLIATPLFAQQPTPPQNPGGRLWAADNLDALLQGQMAHAYSAPRRNIEGQPFFQRTWQPGEIVLVNTKQRIGNILLQFDVFAQQLLAIPRKGKTDTLLLNTNIIQEFVVQDELIPDRLHRFRRLDNLQRTNQPWEYAEVLHEGKYSLLKRHGRQLYRSDAGKVFNSGRVQDRIVEDFSYFLQCPNGSIVPVKLNAKALSNAAPDLAAAINAELTQRKLSARNELEVVALLQAVDGEQPPTGK
ncbi:hypothetical protein LJ737_22405 [Hymenobacter sp. 15J16-1T3B]|uniref:hypothetical protein n=1 Tax=Hymenobacter sp. 15J16-1T3B TaxID=2886941 RepID=UPI001D10CDAF|nr:hypothetical protein [Hymenobacter sp. 15J16-1T3B]MCC3160006.1 hypothetical protein [Hymenobacter sp. 15J16-1T3B]